MSIISLLTEDVLPHPLAVTSFALLCILTWLFANTYRARLPAALPVLDDDLPIKDRVQKWLINAGSALREGYVKYPDQFWIVTSADGPVVVAPRNKLDELRKIADSVISAPEGIRQRLAADYSTIHVESPVRLRVIKGQLNPKLASLMPDVVDEVEAAIADELPKSADWIDVSLNDHVLRIVSRVSSRIFVGPEHCRNEDWMDISINYTIAAFSASYAIKKWPPLLRPFVYRFTPEYRKAVAYHEKAKQFIVPMVKERLRIQDVAKGQGDEYNKPDDVLQWFMDEAEPHQVRDPDFMTREQLSMSMAAIHTTTMGVLQNLYDLAARPEYIGPLQQELHEVLQNSNDLFTKSAMEQLKKLDSFMKEVHRLNPASHSTFNRKFLKDHTFSDGTILRAGTEMVIPSQPMAMDSQFFDNADEFDGFRFSKLRQNLSGADGGREQYVSLSDKGSMQFGYGKHACPGRFFAANEIKVILANIILRYELKMPGSSKERYPNAQWDANIIPDRTGKLLMRKV